MKQHLTGRVIFCVLVLLCFVVKPFTFSEIINSEHDEKNEESKNEETKEDHKLGEALVVYFVIICIIIGGVAREIKKKTGIPYTPMLLVFGMLLGALSSKLGDLGAAVRMVLNINPHGILFIFIPALIFESAFNIDPYLFKREVFQIILLAIPGVIIGALLISFCFRIILGYGNELSWSGCMTFSSIICATDPVAVVALLKELGTPLRFNLLLEGESLLNDGTAMVFYMVFSSLYKGASGTFMDSLIQFMQLSFGGVLVGVLVWVLITQWIRRIVRDDVHTTNLTFLACYLAFFISEFYLEVSGIIAIVSLGVLFSISGKSKIHPESEHSMHAVWHYIQYLLETILFVLTGCFIGQDLLASSLNTINSSDVLKMVAFFFIMTGARFLMLYILKPLLNRTGYPIDRKMIVVLTYGGLRGAVALSLGLIVLTDNSYPERFRDLVIFYLACMIIATVILNGLTIKCVMKKIKFMTVHPITKKMHDQLEKRLVIRSYEQKMWLQRHRYLAQADWRKVFEMAGIYSDIDEISKKRKKSHKLDYLEMEEKNQKNSKFLNPNQQKEDLSTPFQGFYRSNTYVNTGELVEARLRCYQMIKKEIQNTHHKGYCSDDIVENLKDMVDICMEDTDSQIWIVDCLMQGSISLESLAFWLKYKDTFIIGIFAKKIFIDGMLELYDLIYCLINALKNVQSHKSKLFLSHLLVKKIFGEVEKELKKLENQMFNLCDMFPGIVKSLQSKQAAKVILNDQKNFLEECFEEGVLSENEFNRLRRKVDSKIKYLSIGDFDYQMKGFSDLQFVCPIFRYVQDWDCCEGLKDLLSTGKKERFGEGDTIIKKETPVYGVYILTKGRVDETIINKDKLYQDYLGDGNVLNFANILGESHESISTITAVLPGTELVFCETEKIKKLMEHNLDFADKVYKEALITLIKSEKSFADFIFDDVVILNILSEANIKRFDEDVNHSFAQTCFLMKGTVEDQQTKTQFKAPILLENNQIFRFLIDSIVIVIPQSMHVYIKHDFRFSTDKAVGARGKFSLGRHSGMYEGSFKDALGRAKQDGELVNQMFPIAKKKIMNL